MRHTDKELRALAEEFQACIEKGPAYTLGAEAVAFKNAANPQTVLGLLDRIAKADASTIGWMNMVASLRSQLEEAKEHRKMKDPDQ